MAVSGLALVGFVFMHMLGNLQVYLGPEAINAYGHFLQSTPEILWPARLGLLGLVALHIVSAFRLAIANAAARPVGYGAGTTIQATLASRTMRQSGAVLLAFIVYHLLHFTLGVAHPEYSHWVDEKGRHDIYSMVVLSFRNPWISLSYIAAMLLLGMHLSHGVQSLFQSLGWTNGKFRPTLRNLSRGLAALVVLGNCSMPLACWLGFLKLPPGVAP